MILSVDIAHWDDTYASTSRPAHSDGGDRSERVKDVHSDLIVSCTPTRPGKRAKMTHFLALFQVEYALEIIGICHWTSFTLSDLSPPSA